MSIEDDFETGKAYFVKGQFQKAISSLQQVVAFDPEFAAAWRILGASYEELRE